MHARNVPISIVADASAICVRLIAKRMTKRRLAAQAGIAPETFYKALRGQRVSRLTLARIADALGVPDEEIIAATPAPKSRRVRKTA